MSRPRNPDPRSSLEPRFEPEKAEATECGEVGGLWKAHRRWLAAVLLAHMPNEADLEDLLQEVAIALMKNLHQLEDPERLRPWLRTIAVNIARQAARKRTQAPRSLSLEQPGEGTQLDPADSRLERETHQRGQRTELAHVLRLVRRLSAEHREVLLLRAVEGLSQREIAQALDLTVESVESRLARARRKLREAMFKRSGSSLFPPHSNH